MLSLVPKFLFICILLLNFHCCPRESSRTTSATGTDTSLQRSAGSSDIQATAIQANASAVTAVIDSIQTAGGNSYRLYCRLLSSETVQSMPNFAETGQRIMLEPDFEYTASGIPDTTNIRTMRLLSIRTAKQGKVIKGTISLHDKGRWMLLDVSEPQ